jgi:hypothetical protein
MNEMLHQQNFMALFLTHDSPALLPDGSGGGLKTNQNHAEVAGLPPPPHKHSKFD